jgi:carboxypeptidase PM20D1
MKKIFYLVFVLLLVLIGVIAYKSVTFKSRQVTRNGTPKVFPIDENALKHLSEAIRFETVSYDDGHRDTTAFDKLLSYVDSTYPLVQKNLELTSINHFTRVYKWKGKDAAQKPVLLYAHYDVVPVEEVNRSDWKREPFGGEVAEGYLWGRGAIDDKVSVIGILEAAEKLLAADFVPARDVYFVFGHDEEIGGNDGAAFAAKYLEEQKVQTEFHLDEGGLVSNGIVPNMQKPVVLIGTAEKGYMTLELTAKLKGGHSSKPAKETSIQVLSTAIEKLRNHPFPKTSAVAVRDFITYVGPEMPQPLKTVFANAWLFKPVILSVYEKSAEGNAMIRTTMVPTVFNAGVKENLIPGSASVKINCRILTDETAKSVVERIKKIIDDPRIEVKEMDNTFEPSKTTPTASSGFKLLQKISAEIYPDAVVTPFLDIGSTDSKHFDKLGGDVLRFLPVQMDAEILGTFHGVNERVKTEHYMQTIEFYKLLLMNLN